MAVFWEFPPTVARTRTWCQVSTSAVDDEMLAMVLAAETISQARMCNVVPYNADLYAAVLRRVARQLAARGIPLGMTPGDTEYGAARLATFDAEVERLEGPRRKAVV